MKLDLHYADPRVATEQACSNRIFLDKAERMRYTQLTPNSAGVIL